MRSPTLPSVKIYPFVLLLALFCTSIAVVTLPAGAEDPWREGTVEEVPATAPAVRAVARFRLTQWNGALDVSTTSSTFRLGYTYRTESYALDFGVGGTHRNGNTFLPALGVTYEVRPWTISAGWSPERNLLRLQWRPSDVGYFIETFDLGREFGVGISGLQVSDMTVTAAYRLPSQSLQITLQPLSSGWAMTASVAAGQVTVSLRWSPAAVIEEVMPK